MKEFEEIRKYYIRRDLAAREWKRNGGKVVGYFCDIVPDEFILAAGFFPFRLSGDPLNGTEEADKYLVPVNEGFVRSMLNMLITGKYDFLDYLIVPHSRDSIASLYSVLHEIKSFNPSLKIPELYLFDQLHTRFYLSELYGRERTLELKSKLEEWSGKQITRESLSHAISIGNENKTLLKKIAAIRAADHSHLSGTEALQIIGPSMFMLKENYNRLLHQFLEKTEALPARSGVRLFLAGSPADNLQLYQAVESDTATIVAEDNCWGNRYSDVTVDTSIDPLEAIILRYQNKSPCPRMFPMKARIDYFLKSAVAANIQGVIFNVYKNDYLQTWETPEEIKAIEARGIPALWLKHQPYFMSEPEHIKTVINEFISTIK